LPHQKEWPILKYVHQMKRVALLFLIFIGISQILISQQTVKNLIVMIPDGTSSSILALARWYQFGPCVADNCRLAIDPHICGLVSTYNSDSPIGDSAPTGSTYATGYLSNSGFVASYPVSTGNKDLIAIDPSRSYSPLFTVLEAAKLAGKSTGLVVTSQFTHATPADFSAHTPNRDDQERIARQMVHNKLNVVFGGGLKYLDPAQRTDGEDLFNVLRTRNYKLITTREEFDILAPSDTLVYGLFGEKDIPYDLDRDPKEVPSLAEMTRQAIRLLSSDREGFFLMVEGSKIDWAAHTNDAAGIITEFLAFDQAVQEAISFANKDGYTAVVIMPDHGNSGISLGNTRSEGFYDEMDIDSLLLPLKACKRTTVAMAELMASNPERAGSVLQEYAGLSMTPNQLHLIENTLSGAPKDLPKVLARMISDRSYIGFTTHGHTGEDVFLAAYHPAGYRPTGVVKNTHVNAWMQEILGTTPLDTLTHTWFCIDSLACRPFAYTLNLDPNHIRPAKLMLEIESKEKIQAEIIDGTDYITILKKGKPIETLQLPTLALYVEENGHFFLPRDLETMINGWKRN